MRRLHPDNAAMRCMHNSCIRGHVSVPGCRYYRQHSIAARISVRSSHDYGTTEHSNGEYRVVLCSSIYLYIYVSRTYVDVYDDGIESSKSMNIHSIIHSACSCSDISPPLPHVAKDKDDVVWFPMTVNAFSNPCSVTK